MIERVQREFSTGHGPMDIFVRGRAGGSPFALGIENKIDSPEGDNQLCRYERGLKAQFPKDNRPLCFLTLDGIAAKGAPACPLACLSYRTIAEHLDAAIAAASEGQSSSIGLQLARQYLEILRTDVMAESVPEIETLCQALFKDHKEAWRIIRRRLPSERDELHAMLGSATVAAFSQHLGGEWRFSVRRDSYARVFRPAWKALGNREDDPIMGLEAGTDWTYAPAHFRLSADMPDTDGDGRYDYVVRLRVDTRHAAKRHKAVTRALSRIAGFDLPEEGQRTVQLKSTNRLPSVLDKPDTVTDWIMRLPRVSDAIKALDSVLT
ncbi:MAG: PD-(D/E)XK nuclease family protein [Acidimicrobiia bacterium]